MANGDLRLWYSSYDDLPGSDLFFGRPEHGIYTLTEPSVTFGDADNGDQPLPGEDGVRMGRDYQRSASVTLELGVDTVDYPAVRWFPPGRPLNAGHTVGAQGWATRPMDLEILKRAGGNRESWNIDAVAMMRQVWRADSLRGGAGRTAILTYTRAGRGRRLYGRPRQFEIGSEKLTKQGYTPVIAKFTAIDDRFYSDTAKQLELWDYPRIRPPSRPGRPVTHDPDGGGTWPSPIIPSKKKALLTNAGELPVHPTITFHGPCVNPKLTISRMWSVQLSLTLKAGEQAVILAQPWARTVTKYTASGVSAGSVADKLTRASARLSQMVLPPGRVEAVMSSSSKPGMRVAIAWRDAYASW
ncbi:hypothetical protein LUR56_40200 [Streptomyces sp. MT29]|nr:hypothetical protein [Streptomyces sp. MT29]